MVVIALWNCLVIAKTQSAVMGIVLETICYIFVVERVVSDNRVHGGNVVAVDFSASRYKIVGHIQKYDVVLSYAGITK